METSDRERLEQMDREYPTHESADDPVSAVGRMTDDESTVGELIGDPAEAGMDANVTGVGETQTDSDREIPDVEMAAGGSGTARDVDYDPDADLEEMEDAAGFADRSGLASGQTTGGTTNTDTPGGASHPTYSRG